MTGRKRGYPRIVFGFVIAMTGLAAMVSGLVIARQDRGDVHVAHIIVALLFLYAGGRLMSPATVDALADALLKRVMVILPVWPGGRRATDPPPQPGMPPPPSVTGDHPTDVEGA